MDNEIHCGECGKELVITETPMTKWGLWASGLSRYGKDGYIRTSRLEICPDYKKYSKHTKHNWTDFGVNPVISIAMLAVGLALIANVIS